MLDWIDDSFDAYEPDPPDMRLLDGELLDLDAPLPPGLYLSGEPSLWKKDAGEDGPVAVWVGMETKRIDLVFVRQRKSHQRPLARRIRVVSRMRGGRSPRLRRRTRCSGGSRGSPPRLADSDPHLAGGRAGAAA